MATVLCETRCDPACPLVFDRVVVSYAGTGGTVISWALTPEFDVEGQLHFQLQVGTTGSNDADDWEDVGAPVIDQYSAVDGEQRIWGLTRYTHYRVILTAGGQVYYSEPTRLQGTLEPEEWRILQYEVSSKLIEFRRDFKAQEGILLKRRITGTRCPRCTNPLTDDVKDGHCEVCFGTGWRCGYYYPIGCAWMKPLSARSERWERDSGQARGAINDVKISAEMLISITFLESLDVWVNLRTDERWYVQRITNIEEVRGVPVTASIELRLAPVSDILYTVPLPQQEAIRSLLLA